MTMGRPPKNSVRGSLLDPDVRKQLPPPKHLTEAERKEWRAVVKANPHINSDGYSSLLETYVGAVCRRRQAAARLQEEGLTVETAHGSLKPHPCIGIVQGAESAIASLSVKLALAASTRKEMPKEAEPLTIPAKRPGIPGLRLA